MKNARKINLIDGACLGKLFSKAFIVSYRKMPKQNKFTVSFLAHSVKVKKKYLKKSSNINPVAAASTGPCPQLLACYCGSTTLCRRDGNCVALITSIHKVQADHSLHYLSG